MHDPSNEPCQTKAQTSAKPAWSTPTFEVLKIDQTANSGSAVSDSAGLGTSPS
jgi:hypothetical protein